MTGERVALLVDFDDTAAEQNVAETLLKEFGGDGWQGFRESFRNGTMNLRHYQEKAFNQVDATLEEMGTTIAKLAWLRPGLKELNTYCVSNEIQLSIVTNGLEFYVDALLREAQLRSIPSYSIGVTGQPGNLQYSYPYATEACWEWGNCKCKVLNEHRNGDTRIVYAGDGRSDLCAAQQADFVFARSTLLDHCRQLGLPHQEFSDFHEVLTSFKAGIPNIWEPAPLVCS
jgi:2-hydroxy-3-keto-5-methylthiopentenyl-1-phosphate phosphatase